MAPHHILRWGMIAATPKHTRKSMCLPSKWKQEPSSEYASTGSLVSSRLAVKLVDDMEAALQTDPDAWCLVPSEKERRWVAEKMALVFWRLDEPQGGTLDVDLLHHCHLRSRVLRNSYLSYTQAPSDIPRSTYEKRDVRNIDGSLNIWQLLMAFNAHRCDMIDAMEVYETSITLDPVNMQDTPEEVYSRLPVMRAIFVKAYRIREHASAAVLYALTEVMKLRKYPSASRLRRFDADSHIRNLRVPALESTVPEEVVLYVTRIILSFFALLRHHISTKNPVRYFYALQALNFWCNTRQASFIAMTCTQMKKMDIFFQALKTYESAVMGEYDAYMHLQRCVDAHDLTQANLMLALKKEMIVVNICVTEEKDTKVRLFCRTKQHLSISYSSLYHNSFLQILYQHFTERQHEQVQDFWNDNTLEVLSNPNICSSLLFKMMMMMSRDESDGTNDDAISICCGLVTNPRLLKVWRVQMELMCPELCKAFDTRWNLPHTVKMATIASVTVLEDSKRLQRIFHSSEDDPIENFEGLQFSIAALQELEKRATKLGWE